MAKKAMTAAQLKFFGPKKAGAKKAVKKGNPFAKKAAKK